MMFKKSIPIRYWYFPNWNFDTDTDTDTFQTEILILIRYRYDTFRPKYRIFDTDTIVSKVSDVLKVQVVQVLDIFVIDSFLHGYVLLKWPKKSWKNDRCRRKYYQHPFVHNYRKPSNFPLIFRLVSFNFCWVWELLAAQQNSIFRYCQCDEPHTRHCPSFNGFSIPWIIVSRWIEDCDQTEHQGQQQCHSAWYLVHRQ